MEIHNKHYIFSDESGWDADSQYGSIAKVSCSYTHAKELHNALFEILTKYAKNEIKFKDINNRINKEIANKFLLTSFEFLKAGKIKIHIIVWDKHDSRHNIHNRCDIENLKRMYYHNMKSMLKSWKIKTNWHFFPDEFSAIDWKNDIVKFIENTNLSPKDKLQMQLFDESNFNLFPAIENTKELDSKKYPIIQLADLYAGLVRTSRTESDKFNKWSCLQNEKYQQLIFNDNSEVEISKSLLPKFEVMLAFREKAKIFKLGINFSNNKYFTTFDSKKGISIWHYTPQSKLDKAPVKIKKVR